MNKSDRFLNCFTLELYTYKGVDKIGNVVLVNSDNEERHIGEKYFDAKYIPYSEADYLKLKNNKVNRKKCSVCEKDTDDLE